MKIDRKKVSEVTVTACDESKSEGIQRSRKKSAGLRQGPKKKPKGGDAEVEPTVDDTGETRRAAITAKARKKNGVFGKAVNPEAEAAISAFVQNTVASGVDGLRREFAELKIYVPPNYDHNACKENVDKNRYKDVICLDATRVVLTLNVPPEGDYIHANWIKMEHVDKTFIAAQGPLDSTISDFWRMVHQEGVPTVLMLCKFEECGKAKCTQYWPLEQGAYQTYGSMFINNKKVEKEDKFIAYTLEVLPEGCSNSTITKLYQMTDWPDRGVPLSGMSVLRLLRFIAPGGPCVVHCSAGIGRTGTIIAVETAIQRLFKGHQASMRDIVMQLRNQRASSVQTEGQYVFIHSCILSYISVKFAKHREQILTFHEQMKNTALN